MEMNDIAYDILLDTGSYAEDGTIVEIVLLDAKKEGLLPIEFRNAA